ncbi:MAG: hypothetical protein EP338_07260 [Bacteroidetes bacterium]|nr:MAG: hypothetical protein EP338_07260 [Bacteroidota bacterium]
MQHRGKIIEKAIRRSGVPISRVAAQIGKSRRWLYLMFENEHAPLDYVFLIGRVIEHDFTKELVELKYMVDRFDFQKEKVDSEQDYLYWKVKYYELLEETYQLLRSRTQHLSGKRKPEE